MILFYLFLVVIVVIMAAALHTIVSLTLGYSIYMTLGVFLVSALITALIMPRK